MGGERPEAPGAGRLPESVATAGDQPEPTWGLVGRGINSHNSKVPPIETVSSVFGLDVGLFFLLRRRGRQTEGPFPQSGEKTPGIATQAADPVSALLDDQGGQLKTSHQTSVGLEVFRDKVPCAGGVLATGVQTEGNHQNLGPVVLDPAQGSREDPPVPLTVDMLLEWVVAICAATVARSALIRETREVGIGEVRVPVDRHREDIAALPEDVLLAVAVVVVEVEDRDAGGF